MPLRILCPPPPRSRVHFASRGSDNAVLSGPGETLFLLTWMLRWHIHFCSSLVQTQRALPTLRGSWLKMDKLYMPQLATAFTSTDNTDVMGTPSCKSQGIFRVWRDTHSPENPKLISKSSGTRCARNHIECREKCHLRCLWSNGVLFACLGSSGRQQHSINSQERERRMRVFVLQAASKKNLYYQTFL